MDVLMLGGGGLFPIIWSPVVLTIKKRAHWSFY